jgi:calcineurin-like phosphoesterase family protein
MNFWVTTDTHLGHTMLTDNNLRPLGFEDKILKGLMSVIKEGDVLIHLGDVSFGGDAMWSEKLKELPCKRWLLRGNHDKHSLSWYLSHGWDFVADTIAIEHFGYKIIFSHIPHPLGSYSFNIHGHFHDTDHRKHEPEMSAILTDKHYLLALELNNYQPWNLRAVLEDFKKRQKNG